MFTLLLCLTTFSAPSNSFVTVKSGNLKGCGTIVGKTFVATSQHILQKNKSITVIAGGQSYYAMVYFKPASGDFCLLKIRGRFYINQVYIAPQNLSKGKQLFVCNGYKCIPVKFDSKYGELLFMTLKNKKDSLTAGDSGSAILDSNGRLVGTLSGRFGNKIFGSFYKDK